MHLTGSMCLMKELRQGGANIMNLPKGDPEGAKSKAMGTESIILKVSPLQRLLVSSLCIMINHQSLL